MNLTRNRDKIEFYNIYMPVDIYITRHGATFSNEFNIVQGALDSPLSPAGRAAIARKTSKIDSIGFDALVSGSLRRARESADLIVSNLKTKPRALKIDPRLDEIDFGVFNGYPKFALAEIIGYHRNIIESPYPRGESRSALNRRALSFVNEIIDTIDRATYLLVTSLGIFDQINQQLALLESASTAPRIDPDGFWRARFENRKLIDFSII